MTEIPFHFYINLNVLCLTISNLFNKELLNRLANTREKYQRLYQKFTEQTALLTESLTKLQNRRRKSSTINSGIGKNAR